MSNFSSDLLQKGFPHSYNAMTYTVMAFADLHKNAGKKTFFGRDKTVSAFVNMRKKMSLQLNAFLLDEVIAINDSDEHICEAFLRFTLAFAEGNPNWQDAYTAIYEIFVQNPEIGMGIIQQER